MATAAAAVAAKARRDVVSHFLSRNAVTPEVAVPYQPDRRLHRRMFDRLERAGVLRTAGAGYYLDVPRWDALSRQRRRRVGMIAGGLAFAGAMAAIFA